jgi:uncharacterized Zn-finger protein
MEEHMSAETGIPGPQVGHETPNAQHSYEITASDLPLHCPTDKMSLWNSHPRAFINIGQDGKGKCPYCGADFVLKK